MIRVLVAISMMLMASGPAGADEVGAMTLFDFSQEGSADGWRPIDDVVMGGRSHSNLRPTGEGTVVFAGEVSLENNGGFASVRSSPGEHDLGAYRGLSLRVRGDGATYKINLKTDRSFDGILYRAAFETRQGEWQTLDLPFSEFVPTFRGRMLRDAPPLDLSRVASFGLMISDKQEGPFRLEITWIRALPD